MNAQAFFEVCKELTDSELTVQKINSFPTDDDFLDEEFVEEPFLDDTEDNFLEDAEIQSVAEAGVSGVNRIISVSIPCVNASVSDDSLLGYFKEWINANVESGVASDAEFIKVWNQHANTTYDSLEECLRDFVLMHFGIKFIGDESIAELNVSSMTADGLPYPLTIGEWSELSSFDGSLFDLQLLSKFVDMDDAKQLLNRDDYSRDEIIKYADNAEAIQFYVELKLKNRFVPERFDAALQRRDGLLRDRYFDKDSDLFELVADADMVQLLQKAKDVDNTINVDLIKAFKDTGYLKTVLTARLNGVVQPGIEQLLLRCSNVPDWFCTEYSTGLLCNGDSSGSPFYCSATAVCARKGLDATKLCDNDELEKLLSLYHSCRIAEKDFYKILYFITQGIDVSGMLTTEFKSIEHYWISKLLTDAGVDSPIPRFIGGAIVIVNANGKARLLDVETLIYNYEVFRKEITSEYKVELLRENKGILVVHESQSALMQKLIGMRYVASSSLERWAVSTDTVSDPGRYNLCQLLSVLGDEAPSGLSVWKSCPLAKYQQADRCFSYVLDVVPEAAALFHFGDTAKVIRCVLACIQITDKTLFMWHFLKTFFRGCRVIEKPIDKPYCSAEISVDLNGRVVSISQETFANGFSGIAESAQILGEVTLSNIAGKIYVKICKKSES